MTTFNKIVWAVVIGLLLACASSCLTPKEMFNKAITKDPSLVIPSDTVRITTVDTIRGKDGRDSIIHTTETIEIPCNFDVEEFIASHEKKSGRELRFERRESKDNFNHLEKMYKLETNRLGDSLDVQLKLNKQLTKQLNDKNDTLIKLEKQKTKQEAGNWFQRQMGKIWWLLLLAGLIAGLYLRGFIPRIFKRGNS